jgi:ABC-2 type transport system ATP-binding protein
MYTGISDAAPLASMPDRAEKSETGSASTVSFSCVKKSYGQRLALDDVSFEIPKGQIVALVGPNGAGKTTMLEIMMGLRRADSGEVRVLGCDPALDRSYVTKLGVQIQQTRFFSSLTGRDYIRFFVRVYPKTVDVEWMLDEFELRAFVDRPIGKMSGGEVQRIALALAMINDPEFVILDEPTVGLDPLMRRGFWNIIRRAHARGNKSLLFSTHHMEEAEALASRVVMLAAGKIIAQGSVGDLIELAGNDARTLDDAYAILATKKSGDGA